MENATQESELTGKYAEHLDYTFRNSSGSFCGTWISMFKRKYIPSVSVSSINISKMFEKKLKCWICHGNIL